MYAVHLIMCCLLAASPGDAVVAGGVITCYDPEGICAEVPCPCEGACRADSWCPPGQVCRVEPIGPSSCFCGLTHEGEPNWGMTFDGVGRCEPAPVPTGPRGYTIQAIGTLGGLESSARGINNHGQVVGDSSVPQGGFHGYLWENGVMTDITPTPEPNVFAAAGRINDAGQITVSKPGGVFLWEDGSATFIGNPDGHSGLTEQGQVLMGSFIWDDGVITQVSDLSDPPITPRTMNNFQDLGGTIEGVRGKHAALLIDGALIDLGTFGGEFASIRSVNDLGQALGEYAVKDERFNFNHFHPFLWTGQDTIEIVDLPTGCADQDTGGAFFINNCSEMTMAARNCGGITWSTTGYYTDATGYRPLEALIDAGLRWYDMVAVDINERGQIVGTGTKLVPGVGWLHRGFVMTPVPGDFNLDGPIDLNDYVLFFERFGHETTNYSIYCNRADFDEDGDTDLNDFARFQTFFTGGRIPA